MDMMMVCSTKEGCVAQAGFTAVGPMLDVMTFQVEVIRTTWERACLVSLDQRALEPARDRAPLAAHRERDAIVILDHLGHAAVTAQPPCSFAGYE